MADTAKLEKLHTEYLKSHPDAQNPLDYLVALGEEGLLEALQKRKGRKIVFEEIDNSFDNVNYHFE